MTRQAKLSISADVTSLKASVAQAKKTMESLGQVKISNKALDGIKEAFGKDLVKKITNVSSTIDKLEGKIEKLGKTGKSTMSAEFQKTLERAKSLRVELENLKKVKDRLDKGEIGVPEASKKTGGMMKAVTGGVGKVAGAVGLGMGISELYNTGKQMASQRANLRALTGGSIVGADSTMGYSPEERRQRATGIAGALGRNVSGKELTGLTNFGERMERGYGVDEGTLSGTIKEGRKAGVDDQQKYMASAIGVAVSNGLEGGRIGEYLASMNDFMGELSDGITINNDSVNAISGAFGEIPFFKNDPSRLFNQMRGMNQAFTGGDRFQQAQAARAIQASPGGQGSSPAGVELRRSLGLFGGSAELAKTTGIKSLGVKGTDVLQNMFKEIKTSTSGMSKEEQMYEMMSRSGLKGEGGMRIANKVMKGQTAGITEKEIQLAQMNPEEQLKTKVTERLTETFVKTDSDILVLSANIQGLKEFLAGDMLSVLSSLLTGINKIVDLIPGVESLDKVKTAGRVVEGAVIGFAGKKLLEKLTPEALPNAGRWLGTQAGKIGNVASKLAPEAGQIAGKGAGLLGKMAPYAGTAAKFAGSAAGVLGAIWPEEMGNPDDLLPSMNKERGAMMAPGEGVLARPEGQGAVSLPDSFQTTDPIANQLLAGILMALQGKGPSVLIDRRGPVAQFGNGKVGK